MMAPKKFLPENEISFLYVQGWSLERLSNQYECSFGTIRNMLIRMGVKRRGPGKTPNPASLTKVCSSCNEEKDREDFPRRGQRSSECKRCASLKFRDRYDCDPEFRERVKASAARRQAEKPDEIRAYNRQRATGWSPEEFESAWLKQSGQCAICLVPMLRSGRTKDSVCADHCHTTGKPRELLCRLCNMHLGVFEKHREKLQAYLEKHGAEGGV